VDGVRKLNGFVNLHPLWVAPLRGANLIWSVCFFSTSPRETL